MKKLLVMISAGITLLLASCTKNDIPTFSGAVVEWDASAWNANAAGLTYPMMVRVPIYGFATPTSAALITRTSGTVTLRVNLVGAQAATDRAFTFKFNQSESSGVPGTHFEAVTGTGTIPANSSFGFVVVKILNPGVGVGQTTVVLEITDNGTLKPSVNYSKVGISIRQS